MNTKCKCECDYHNYDMLDLILMPALLEYERFARNKYKTTNFVDFKKFEEEQEVTFKNLKKEIERYISMKMLQRDASIHSQWAL